MAYIFLTGGLFFAGHTGYRRSEATEGISFALFFEDYTFDTERRELRRGPEVVPTPPQVFDLLHYLISNRERLVSKGRSCECHLERTCRIRRGADDPSERCPKRDRRYG
jgi:hypothetical protein